MADGGGERAGVVELRPLREDEVPAFLALLEGSFGEEMSAAAVEVEREVLEVERCLVATTPADTMVATSGAFTLELALPGGASVGCAAVTVVSVRQDHRRRGLLTRMMRHLLDQARARGEPTAALWASEGAIYGRYGFGPAIPMQELSVPRAQLRWRDPVSTRAVELVGPEAALARVPSIYARARQQRAGMLSRDEAWWRRLLVHDLADQRHGAGPRNIAVLDDRGYVTFRLKGSWEDGVAEGTAIVAELVAVDPEATAALWAFVGATDLAATIRAPARPVDDPLPAMLVDVTQVRARRFPPVYVRVLDVPAILEARGYLADGAVTIGVDDPTYPDEVSGCYRLEVVDGTGRCERAETAAPDLRLGIEELSTVVLGGVSPRTLAEARRIVEERPGAVDRLAGLLRTSRAPLQTSEF